MIIACPQCHQGFKVEDKAAGKEAKCPKCGTALSVPSPAIAPVRDGATTVRVSILGWGLASLLGVVLLHYATLGVFSVVWMALMHGRLPKTRENDPSASKAVGLLFVPFVNIGWVCFILDRLVSRVNDDRLSRGLSRTKARWLSNAVIIDFILILAIAVLMACVSFHVSLAHDIQEFAVLLALINWAILVPALLSVMQTNMNLLRELDRRATQLDEIAKSCPKCNETIAKTASACRSCGYRFGKEEVANAKAELNARSVVTHERNRIFDLQAKGQLFLFWGATQVFLGVAVSVLLLGYSNLSRIWAEGDVVFVLFWVAVLMTVPFGGGGWTLTKARRVAISLARAQTLPPTPAAV